MSEKVRADLSKSDWSIIIGYLTPRSINDRELEAPLKRLKSELIKKRRKVVSQNDCCFQWAYEETCSRCGGDN